MEYQKSKAHKPRFSKNNRPLGFHGYYVEIPDGDDPMRGYRKMKKQIKILLRIFIFKRETY